MILNADIVHQIAGGKRSMIRLPIKGKCPVREGHVYEIKTARDAPISCHITIASISETMLDDIPTWTIRFQKGDHSDKARIPAAKPGAVHFKARKGQRWKIAGSDSDYVTSASRALSGAAEEIPAATQGIYAEQASNGGTELRNGQWRTDRARLLKVVQEIRLEIAKQNCGSSSARRRLKTVEHNLRALQREMAA